MLPRATKPFRVFTSVQHRYAVLHHPRAEFDEQYQRQLNKVQSHIVNETGFMESWYVLERSANGKTTKSFTQAGILVWNSEIDPLETRINPHPQEVIPLHFSVPFSGHRAEQSTHFGDGRKMSSEKVYYRIQLADRGFMEVNICKGWITDNVPRVNRDNPCVHR